MILRLLDSNTTAYKRKTPDCIIHSRVSSFTTEETSRSLSIKYVFSGKEVYHQTNGPTHRIRPGQFLLMDRGVDYTCDMNLPQPSEGVCIYIGEEILRTVASHSDCSNEALLDQPDREGREVPGFFTDIFQFEKNPLEGLLNDLSLTLQRGEDPDEETFYYDLASRLLSWQLQMNKEMERLDSEKKTTRNELYRRLLKARTYIDTRYNERLNNELLAQEACLSKYHFLRTFRKAFGETPRQYLIQTRIEKASELLKKSSRQVDEIAHLTGFSDIFSFSSSFKRATGYSPTQFRSLVK